MGASFPREARLLKPEEFVRVLKTRPFRGKFLWIYRLDRGLELADETRNLTSEPAGKALVNRYSGPQLGLMIGKRNAKTAVLRNAIKRRLREQFRLRAAELPARAYVARLSANASKALVSQIVGEWVNCLEIDKKKNSRLPQVKTGEAA